MPVNAGTRFCVWFQVSSVTCRRLMCFGLLAHSVGGQILERAKCTHDKFTGERPLRSYMSPELTHLARDIQSSIDSLAASLPSGSSSQDLGRVLEQLESLRSELASVRATVEKTGQYISNRIVRVASCSFCILHTKLYPNQPHLAARSTTQPRLPHGNRCRRRPSSPPARPMIQASA